MPTTIMFSFENTLPLIPPLLPNPKKPAAAQLPIGNSTKVAVPLSTTPPVPITAQFLVLPGKPKTNAYQENVYISMASIVYL